QQFYSSKPPLLPTLLAGEYWLLKHGLGYSITAPDGVVIRTILLTINALPLIFYWLLLARLVERLGGTDWGKLYVMTAGCFATYLTTFAVTLNNHTVASWSGLFALYFTLRLWNEPDNGWARFALAGFFAGFTASNELPAASLAAALLLIALARRL